MREKLSCIVSFDDLLIGASLFGDLLLWSTPRIFQLVEKRLRNQQELDKMMSNPEEDKSKLPEYLQISREEEPRCNFI